MTAVKLAWEILVGRRQAVSAAFSKFKEYAGQKILPLDTQGIVDAARRRDIPVWKMDRYPYGRDPKDAELQARALRQNGLLSLGQGAHKVEIEGTFCSSRSPLANDLLEKPALTVEICQALGVPYGDAGQCAGRRRTLLLIGGRVVAELNESGRLLAPDCEERLHHSYRDAAIAVAASLDAGLLSVTFHSSDFEGPLGQTGQLTGIDPAPDLSNAGPEDGALLAAVADAFVAWLYPSESASRIPIAAVTGSNGKTTTSRMIAHILQLSGATVGLACTDGVYVAGEQRAETDSGGATGHAQVLFDGRVEAAVLETHHNSLFQEGLIFDRCDVAVCTGVTDEHLGFGMIDSVEAMARIKGYLLENAETGAVIDADNQASLSMLPRLVARTVCLVSREQTAEQLRNRFPRSACQCVLDNRAGTAWLVLYEDGAVTPLLPASEIPATFGGKAGFNVSNALHAAAACHVLGVSVASIADGLRTFEAGYQGTPGRLNFHDNGEFQVLVDFAHNADGLRALCGFVDQLPVDGRRILMFAMSGDRRDDAIRAAAREVAGHFDHYVCRRYPSSRGRETNEVPTLLSQGLQDGGVQPSCITTAMDPVAAVAQTLDMARPGDLVVLTHSHEELEAIWRQAISSKRSKRLAQSREPK
jgi:cyanophycin synthetase